MIKKKIKKLVTISIWLMVMGMINRVGISKGFLVDTEEGQGQIKTDQFDIQANNIQVEDIKPTNQKEVNWESKDIFKHDFNYDLQVSSESNKEVCQAIQVDIYSGDGQNLLWEGSLPDLDIKSIQFNNLKWKFNLVDENANLQEQECLVTIDVTARMQGVTSFQDKESLQVQVKTGDWLPPVVSLWIEENGKSFEVQEKVKNGSFENGKNDWWSKGQVITTSKELYQGEKAIRLGYMSGNNGNYLWENQLGQVLGEKIKTVRFWYNFFTTDQAPFDEPGFIARINGVKVKEIKASDLSGTGERSTGWQEVAVDTADIEGPIQILFAAGNTGDQENQSWVYIDGVSTVPIVTKGNYYIQASDEKGSGVDKCWQKWEEGNWEEIGVNERQDVTKSGRVEIYCQDKKGNKSERQSYDIEKGEVNKIEEIWSGQQVFIQEVGWTGYSNPYDEWIKIYNSSNQDVDLSRWHIKDVYGTDMFIFPQGTTIKKGEDLVIGEYDSDHSYLSRVDLVVGGGESNETNFAVSNSNLAIELDNDKGQVIDVAWRGGMPEWGDKNNFYSMKRGIEIGGGEEEEVWFTNMVLP